MSKFLNTSEFKTVAIDTPGGKRNLKMKIKAQQENEKLPFFI
jgi:hypothetical protein